MTTNIEQQLSALVEGITLHTQQEEIHGQLADILAGVGLYSFTDACLRLQELIVDKCYPQQAATRYLQQNLRSLDWDDEELAEPHKLLRSWWTAAMLQEIADQIEADGFVLRDLSEKALYLRNYAISTGQASEDSSIKRTAFLRRMVELCHDFHQVPFSEGLTAGQIRQFVDSPVL